jgi:hypothetical protein
MDKYSKDEALRITSAEAMIEGHTFVFRVHNSGGRFIAMLEKHEYPKGLFQKSGVCCKNVADPCACESKELKDAIRQSIEMHQKLVHHLKVAL